MPRLAKSTKIQRDKGAIAGIRKNLRQSSKVVLEGVEYTPDEVAAVFEEHLEALAHVADMTRRRRMAVEQERALEKKAAAMHAKLKQHVVGLYGKHSQRLRHFGIAPEKKPKMSAETKQRANEKRQATRKERGIMGKRQLREWKKKRQAGIG